MTKSVPKPFLSNLELLYHYQKILVHSVALHGRTARGPQRQQWAPGLSRPDVDGLTLVTSDAQESSFYIYPTPQERF